MTSESDDLIEIRQLQAFGKRVAFLRKSRGLTQQELSEILEVDISTIGRIEIGQRWPHLRSLNRIAAALNVSVAEFFNETSDN